MQLQNTLASWAVINSPVNHLGETTIKIWGGNKSIWVHHVSDWREYTLHIHTASSNILQVEITGRCVLPQAFSKPVIDMGDRIGA